MNTSAISLEGQPHTARMQRLASALANLDEWLQSMRQPGGYSGPVVHWWRHSLLYAGPGMDWRYEGILAGYATLYRKTGNDTWLDRVKTAIDDLLTGRLPSGSLRGSEFEANPGTLGTPHEAAAVAGLLGVLDLVDDDVRHKALILSEGILRNLVNKLWDPNGQGFNDRPGIPARVPNKLATLAEALIGLFDATGERQWLNYARSCLEDVVRYQVSEGLLTGAVHQYAPRAEQGDGRFFPYYNARCIPALVKGAKVFDDPRYLEAASGIRNFLQRSLHGNRWPQIVYRSGKQATFPSWIAATGDILRALSLLGNSDDLWSHPALDRLLQAQMPTGGFPTAEGFGDRAFRKWRQVATDWLDVFPVCGWNDKVLRLFAELAPHNMQLLSPSVNATHAEVLFYRMPAKYEEDLKSIRIRLKDRVVMEWKKGEPWVNTQFRPPAL